MTNVLTPNHCLRPMTQDDLLMVLEWRNHPDVKRYMYTNHEITLEEHTKWFERESVNRKRRLFIFESNGTPLGFVNFISISTQIIDWGFYLAPTASKGTGSILGEIALEYAFCALKLHKIMGYVIALNERSLRFHEKLGFMQEGLLREQHFDGVQYLSVVCFGLLKNDWLSLEAHNAN
jgi:UDP-4-amino-4,6-dideoxy-N-acetyl-beta-L-altrosamine N-acetyltransferase